MAKGKAHRIHHEIHDDKSVSYTIHRKSGPGPQKGAFLMDHSEESGTHKTAHAAGEHLKKVLKEAGVPAGTAAEEMAEGE